VENPWLLAIAIGITIAAFVAALVVDRLRKQIRTRQMRAVAARLGYVSDETGDGLADSFQDFALFFRGGARRTANLLCSPANDGGDTIRIFDYAYEVRTGKNRRVRWRTALLIESERLDLPAFTLRPEGFSQKLQGLVREGDIDFEDQPHFSAAYVLHGPDEARIRALFSPDKLAFFAQRRGLSIEGNRRKAIYYQSNKRVSPRAMPSFLEEGLAVLNVLAG